MIAKSLIAAAAVASTMALAPVQQAQAGVDINIGIGVPGFYPGYYEPYPVYNPGYISCKKGRAILDFQKGFNNVKAVDCKLPGYRYTAWKNGHKWMVRLNGYGDVTNVSKIF